MFRSFFFLWIGLLIFPPLSLGQEIKPGGWPIPNLKGLEPYTISIKQVDGVEKVVEKFYTPTGGHIARISANGRVFAYAVDQDQEPPIDYLILDPDGSGRFTEKYRSENFFQIPEWVTR